MAPVDLLSNVQHITTGPAVEALGLIHRVRVPVGDTSERYPTLVMLHGYQGNEDVTWVFARSAGPRWLIVTPRAPIAAPDHGFSWNSFSGGKTDPETLQQSTAALTRFVEGLADVYAVDRTRVALLGFSQGGGMCYAFAATAPQPPLLGIAALGGYIPATVQLQALAAKPVLVLHGTKDETIPIAIARENHEQLLAVGAQVTYQEDEVGHKVGPQGMRVLASWLADRLD
jgi:phospholipase/carboxylesterase